MTWSGHPDGRTVTFTLDHGNLVARDPDRATIAKLVDLSNDLRGRVLGDEGERYGRDGSWTHPAAAMLASSIVHTARDRRSFFRSLVGITRPNGQRSPRSVLGGRSPFRKGDRVRDIAGNAATVLGLEHVDGRNRDIIACRYDAGHTGRFPVGAHRLERIDS
jgi:hypothetical protein